MSDAPPQQPEAIEQKEEEQTIAEPEELPEEGTIKFGDTIIIFENIDRISVHQLVQFGRYDGKFGTFYNMDFVGKHYGEPVYDNRKTNHVFPLKFCSKLWTLALDKRTQVLYLPDIATIINGLNVQAGDVIVEAGTGSGSLSHAFSEALGPTGHLYTFEFHEERAKAAKAEFDAHGLTNVTSTHRDVANGFAADGVEGQYADGLFLDVPQPWIALQHIIDTVKPGHMFVSFSPCIEQVQRTVTEAAQLGYTDIVTETVSTIVYDRRSRVLLDAIEQTITQLETGGKTVEKRLSKKIDDDEAQRMAAEATERRKRSVEVMRKVRETLPHGDTVHTMPMHEQATHTGYLSFMQTPIAAEPVKVELVVFERGGKRKNRGRGRGRG